MDDQEYYCTMMRLLITSKTIRLILELWVKHIFEGYQLVKDNLNTSVIKATKQSDSKDVKVGFNQGMLRVSVPEEMIKAELSVYNLMGQPIYRTKMNQTEETVCLDADTNFYIVVLNSGNTIVSRKVIAL